MKTEKYIIPSTRGRKLTFWCISFQFLLEEKRVGQDQAAHAVLYDASPLYITARAFILYH